MKYRIKTIRRAFTVTELLVALALLATAIGLSSMLMTRMLTARAASQAKIRAWAAAENVMEEVSARGWTELPAGPLVLAQAAEEVAAVVPDGTLEVQIVETAAPSVTRRIDVVVRGSLPGGSAALPGGSAAPLVRLSTWVFPPSSQASVEVQP